MNDGRKTVRQDPIAAYIPALAAAAAAVALLAASALPFATVQAVIDRLSVHGHAESFTPALFHSLALRLRVMAVALAVAALFLARYRRALTASARRIVTDLSGYVADQSRAVRRVARREPLDVVLLVAVTALGAAVRALALSQPVNYDEAFTFITYVRRPLWVALADYSYPNNHLLHTVLAHASTALFGMAPPALRLPAFAAGVLVIPLTYVAARKLYDGPAALIASAMVAASEALIAFSVLARGYSLTCACFLIALVCARDATAGNDRRAWVPFVAAASLGLYAVPTFAYALVVLAIWIAWTDRRRVPQLLAAAAATALIAALLYLPPALVSGLGAGLAYGYGSATAGTAVTVARFVADCWTDWTRSANIVLAAIVAAAAAAALLFGRRSPARLAAVTLACGVAAVAVQRVVMPPRVWLFALPVLVMTAAAGFALAVRRSRVAVVALTLLFCADAYRARPPEYTEVFDSNEIDMVRGIEPVTMFLKERLRPDDAAVSAFPTIDLLDYYFRLHDVPVAALRNPPAHPARYFIVTNDAVGNALADVLTKQRVTLSPAHAMLLFRSGRNAVYALTERPQQAPAGPAQ